LKDLGNGLRINVLYEIFKDLWVRIDIAIDLLLLALYKNKEKF